MDQLLALPIRGESFLLRRGSRHILVDGGGSLHKISKSGQALARSLSTVGPSLRTLDVVVCTHADGDHAAGLASLLDHWRVPDGNGGEETGRIGQFWLPGRWVDVLPELMRTPETFLDGLIAALDQVVHEGPNLAQSDGADDDLVETLDAMVRRERRSAMDRELNPEGIHPEPQTYHDLVGDDDVDLGGTEPLDEPGWFSDLRRDVDGLEGIRPKALKALESARRRILYRRAQGKIGAALAQFWFGLIDTAASIRGIADQAIRHRVRVRWFDFDEFERKRCPRGGVPGFLVPINAVEQAPPPTSGISYLAQLSAVNEACLSFFAPPTARRLGVVFCGDSPFGDGQGYANSFLLSLRSPLLPVVATAPHHGSESNAMAYGHVERWANVQVWLRTGGTSKQPGPTFKQIVFPRRVCTYCPQTNRQPRLAGICGACSFPSCGPLWITGHHCICP
jgi:hypothetical protein